MSDNAQNNPAAGAAGQNEQQPVNMSVQHIFLKDCSFEAPGALEMDNAEGQPDLNMNLSQRTNQLADNRWEVILTVTVTAKKGEQTAFLAEVQYSGVFQFTGFSEQQMPYAINVLCPNVLYPYARSKVSDLVSAGGFMAPPMQPINFEAIFAQRVREAQEKDQAGGDSQSPVN